MANRLAMADIDTILTLHTSGHSQRSIAELLGIDRETVGKYVARAKARDARKAVLEGNPGEEGALPPIPVVLLCPS